MSGYGQKGRGPGNNPIGRSVGSAWNRQITGEPSIAEILSDPIVHLVMRRDGVTPGALESLISEARSSELKNMNRVHQAA